VPVQVKKYMALLTEAVHDGRLTYEEADALTRQARLTRLTGPQLRELHQKAWEETYPDAKDADWTALAPVERREMYLLAERQREIDRYAALRQQRADEADAYWRPSWRREELDYDPEPEPWWE
jgi:hypothetical protein